MDFVEKDSSILSNWKSPSMVARSVLNGELNSGSSFGHVHPADNVDEAIILQSSNDPDHPDDSSRPGLPSLKEMIS